MEGIVIEKRPIFECVLSAKDSSLTKATMSHDFVPYVVDEDVSLTKVEEYFHFKSTRKLSNESITSPSKLGFMLSKTTELNKIYSELNFDNSEAYKISFNLLNELAKYKKFDINISKSPENEIVFYSSKNGRFNNLLIDNDGDVSYIYIGKVLGEEKSKFFPFNSQYSISDLVELI